MFTVKRYINREGKRCFNIWNGSSWVFDYEHPKKNIYVCEWSEEDCEMFYVSEFDSKESYIFNATTNNRFEIDDKGYGIDLSKCLSSSTDNRVMLFACKNKGYACLVLDKNIVYLITVGKDAVDWCGHGDKYIWVAFDTGKVLDTPLGHTYGHTDRYYRIFDMTDGRELFSDFRMSDVLFTSSDDIIAYSDRNNSFILDYENECVKRIYEGYVFYAGNCFFYEKECEGFCLVTKEWKYMEDSNKNNLNGLPKDAYRKLYIDCEGNVLFEYIGGYISELNDCLNWVVGRDEMYKGWFYYWNVDGCLVVRDISGNILLPFDDCEEMSGYVKKDGSVYFSCKRRSFKPFLEIYDGRFEKVLYKGLVSDTVRYDNDSDKIVIEHKRGKFFI